MHEFAHLHVHSHYTLLGGTADVTDLAARAAAEALGTAGLIGFSREPSEAIDLHLMRRKYNIFVTPGQRYQVGPFTVTAGLSWDWDAALAARSATTEEDLLIELLGQDGYYLVTEQPWLRVDVTLNAALPLDSPLQMPETKVLHRWAADVTARLEPLLPIGKAYEGDPSVLSWRDEPIAHLRCASEGHLYLTGVELSAWQGIGLPRQWDNPDRSPDEGTEEQVDDLAGRVRQALQEWGDSLRLLH